MVFNKRNIIESVCILCVIFIGILKPTNSQWLVDDEGCRTPDGGVGNCISVRKCNPMLDFIKKASAAKLSSSIIGVLQKYQCGFEGNDAKVCCPDGPISVGLPPITSGTPPPPDVSNHRNLELLPYDCGVHFKDRIIGGNRTGLFEYPWMALLAYDTGKGNSFRCGGSVISDQYILTASHCITNLPNLKLVHVRVGEHDTETEIDCETNEFGDEVCADPVQDIGIEEILPHPDYNPKNFTNDIGLIRLSTKINMTVDTVKPVCLPTTKKLSNLELLNMKLTVTGYGATETGRRSNVLLYVNVPVTTDERCRKAYEKTPAKLTYKQFCAGGEDGRDSCAGDSGGPLQNFTVHNNDLRYIQYGVVSFGPTFCGKEGFPGVYTKIGYYMDWILDTMRP